MGQGSDNEEKWYYSFLPNNMAGGATSPLIPLFASQVLGGTLTQVGLISTVSSLASVPSNILWGISLTLSRNGASSCLSASAA